MKQEYQKLMQTEKAVPVPKGWMDGASVWLRPLAATDALAAPSGTQARYIQSRLKQFAVR